jgi:hypothetical protein
MTNTLASGASKLPDGRMIIEKGGYRPATSGPARPPVIRPGTTDTGPQTVPKPNSKPSQSGDSGQK